jgi:hypothetical protein
MTQIQQIVQIKSFTCEKPLHPFYPRSIDAKYT